MTQASPHWRSCCSMVNFLFMHSGITCGMTWWTKIMRCLSLFTLYTSPCTWRWRTLKWFDHQTEKMHFFLVMTIRHTSTASRSNHQIDFKFESMQCFSITTYSRPPSAQTATLHHTHNPLSTTAVMIPLPFQNGQTSPPPQQRQ